MILLGDIPSYCRARSDVWTSLLASHTVHPVSLLSCYRVQRCGTSELAQALATAPAICSSRALSSHHLPPSSAELWL